MNSNRSFCKIATLIFYSHGIVHSVEFRYRPPQLGGPIERLSFKISDIKKINKSSFANNIFTQFFSCNTATEKEGTSFAKEWFNNGLGYVKAEA